MKMENKFNDFSEITDISVNDVDDKAENKPKKHKKVRCSKKMDKKKYKQLKRQTKLLEQCCKHTATEEPQAEREKAESKVDNTGKSTAKEDKTFWSKLGDAFIKAFPTLIVTIATTVIGAIFGRKRKANRGWAMA